MTMKNSPLRLLGAALISASLAACAQQALLPMQSPQPVQPVPPPSLPPPPPPAVPVLQPRSGPPVQAMPAPAAPTAKGIADLERAKREAVAADRHLRADQPAQETKTPDFGGSGADTPLERFDKAADAAFIDRSKTRIVDQYRSPDGVIIERITYGNRSYCVTSSTHNYVPGILHDSSQARVVTCPPASADWRRK